jgi:transposase InsO family protein
VKFAFIGAHRDAHEVTTLCRVLGMSKAINRRRRHSALGYGSPEQYER